MKLTNMTKFALKIHVFSILNSFLSIEILFTPLSTIYFGVFKTKGAVFKTKGAEPREPEFVGSFSAPEPRAEPRGKWLGSPSLVSLVSFLAS